MTSPEMLPVASQARRNTARRSVRNIITSVLEVGRDRTNNRCEAAHRPYADLILRPSRRLLFLGHLVPSLYINSDTYC